MNVLKEIKFKSNGLDCEVVLVTFAPANLDISVVPAEIIDMISRQWYNGYVLVPKGHPWYGVSYDDIPLEDGVHGGLTYSGKSGDFWKIGFDTVHCGDTIEEWSEEATKNEVMRLASQVSFAWSN